MLKNMKIRTRMLVSYFIIVALLLVVGITSIIMLQQVSGKLQQFYNQQFKTVENSMNIRRTVFSARGNILGSILLVDSVEIQDAVNAAEDDFASIYTLVDEIRTTYQGDKSQLDRVVSNLDKAKPILDQVGEHSKRMENEEAFELYMNSYKPYMDEVRDIMAQVGDVAEANALDKVEDGATWSSLS
jgi:methyl-accepting chemotaxis protein